MEARRSSERPDHRKDATLHTNSRREIAGRVGLGNDDTGPASGAAINTETTLKEPVKAALKTGSSSPGVLSRMFGIGKPKRKSTKNARVIQVVESPTKPDGRSKSVRFADDAIEQGNNKEDEGNQGPRRIRRSWSEHPEGSPAAVSVFSDHRRTPTTARPSRQPPVTARFGTRAFGLPLCFANRLRCGSLVRNVWQVARNVMGVQC